MHARTALLAAIVCGALAVGLVAADVAWSLEATLETRRDGEWEAMAMTGEMDRPYPAFPGSGCATAELRLIANNDKPFSDTFEVVITIYNVSASRYETLYRDTWRLDSFSSRTHEFQLPAEVFQRANTTASDRDDPKILPNLDVRVGDQFMHVCVEEATA